MDGKTVVAVGPPPQSHYSKEPGGPQCQILTGGNAGFPAFASGFPVDDEEVITASYATARYLREISPASCWVMLECEGLEEFGEFIQDEGRLEYIVIGDSRSRFDFATLNRVLRLLLSGSRMIGMIPELTDSSLGEVELNVGSWVRMLETAAGTPAVNIGKPNRYVFELAIRSMGLAEADVLAVDRISTDIIGGENAGAKTLLFKTGEFQPKDLESPMQPDFVGSSIADVLEVVCGSGAAKS